MDQQSSSSSSKLVHRLKCSVQNYDWGLPASVSRVASLYALTSSLPLDHHPNKPYAELWMGTHQSAPSYLYPYPEHEHDTTTLKSWLSQHPEALGEKVVNTWGSHLPFLFKVLSVGKPLSIQAHPDRDLAALLHQKLPNIYKDTNHKPEMAIAITHFDALCGFLSIQELQDVVASVPEVGELIGNANKDQVLQFNVKDGQEMFKPLLKEVFTQLISADEDLVAQLISKAKLRLQIENQVGL